MRADVAKMKFKGLKWNKIGPIKSELNERLNTMLKRSFRIMFTIGTTTIATTDTFHIVTNSNQVPEELRSEVRPGMTKKKDCNSSPSKKRRYDDSDGSEWEDKQSPPQKIVTRSKNNVREVTGNLSNS